MTFDFNLNTVILIIVLLMQMWTIRVHNRKNETLSKVLETNSIAIEAVRTNTDAVRTINTSRLTEHGQKIDSVKQTVQDSATEIKQTIVDASDSSNKLKTLPPNTI